MDLFGSRVLAVTICGGKSTRDEETPDHQSACKKARQKVQAMKGFKPGKASTLHLLFQIPGWP